MQGMEEDGAGEVGSGGNGDEEAAKDGGKDDEADDGGGMHDEQPEDEGGMHEEEAKDGTGSDDVEDKEAVKDGDMEEEDENDIHHVVPAGISLKPAKRSWTGGGYDGGKRPPLPKARPVAPPTGRLYGGFVKNLVKNPHLKTKPDASHGTGGAHGRGGGRGGGRGKGRGWKPKPPSWKTQPFKQPVKEEYDTGDWQYEQAEGKDDKDKGWKANPPKWKQPQQKHKSWGKAPKEDKSWVTKEEWKDEKKGWGGQQGWGGCGSSADGRGSTWGGSSLSCISACSVIHAV